MERSASSLAALLLAQRLVDVDATPLKASEFWTLIERVGDPSLLLGMGADGISGHLGIDAALAERVAALLDAATAVAFRLEEAEQSGLQVVTPFDDGYPRAFRARLAGSAPPLLYAVGQLSLLAGDALGIVGSRAVEEAGGEVTRKAAVTAVEHGCGVVSGGAKGVDRLAMTAALDAGGTVVGVLADSLLRTVRDPEVRRAVGDGSLVLCSPYKPTAGFTVASAMGRNKLIYGLSRATLVVASEHDKGGTWAGAVEALRQRLCPVLVWTGEGKGEGNHVLVARGATAVADLGQLFPLPAPPAVPAAAAEQLVLELP